MKERTLICNWEDRMEIEVENAQIFGLSRRLFLSLLRGIRGGRITPMGTGGGVTAW